MIKSISHQFYIDPSIFELLQWDQIDHPENRDKMVGRPHEIFRHADSKINTAQNDHDLVDGICALKRCVMIRTKDLRALYKVLDVNLSKCNSEIEKLLS